MKNKKAENKQQARSAVLAWSDHAWEDYLFWQDADLKILQRINDLIEECLADPFNGTGKPEPLKGDLTGCWSRRIDRQHRLVYLPDAGCIYVAACRYHYDDK
ncbi:MULTISPECIES: Txe/YoeB family addiction module toxin [unclassified Janthinobacterium]|uniref:Txe/YoeB family addiction module toxin n=1 Tax=unclassified Janthinobacterium TaxID=2610881 RepID=UPI0016083B7C|nr:MULTISPECIES: Txe/YoeB family addiction module toxin [unclassified Janthinobacterium]MBB5609652.1 toxin YoeB [Janthinobacterium sp. S3T4]MBB5614824.1 toxin YoeB [Janthinobacterium sp. S3M3]